MIKIWGAFLLMAAGGLICFRWIAEKRSELRRLQELSAALERMSGVIRWQMLPLPRVLQQESKRERCGNYFFEVCVSVKSGVALHSAWNKVFSDVTPLEAANILCALDLSGDAQQITAALHLAGARASGRSGKE